MQVIPGANPVSRNVDRALGALSLCICVIENNCDFMEKENVRANINAWRTGTSYEHQADHTSYAQPYGHHV